MSSSVDQLQDSAPPPVSSVSPRSKTPTHSFRRLYSSVSTGSEHEELDYSTANDVFPMRVSLETLEVGSWTYAYTDMEDIELLYELESSDLVISTSVRGTNNAVPATFRIKDITAADVSLISIVPGSLESMVVRVVLETDEKISYLPHMPKGENDSITNADENDNASRDLDVCIVRMTASVHETGHLRDILFFLKRDDQGGVSQDSLFVRDKRPPQEEENPSTPKLTLVEGLPPWVLYIPWMVYSKRTRHILQRIIFIYTIISVLWAMWQLYRHVNVIRVVIQPIVAALKYYLLPLFDLLDWMFAVFTLWWHTFLSPLNVLRGLLLAPMLQFFTHFKYLFYPIYLSISQLFQNTGLITALATFFSVLYSVICLAGSTLWMFIRVILKPLIFVWQGILNSRIAVASMDFQRLRISWVFGLMLNSIRSIFKGLAAFVGYTRKETKIKKAIKSSSTPLVTPVSTPASGKRRRKGAMPILYNSPLSKQQ